jgi:hypothetical protein
MPAVKQDDRPARASHRGLPGAKKDLDAIAGAKRVLGSNTRGRRAFGNDGLSHGGHRL